MEIEDNLMVFLYEIFTRQSKRKFYFGYFAYFSSFVMLYKIRNLVGSFYERNDTIFLRKMTLNDRNIFLS